TWTYIVTNPGNVSVHDVAVTDDHGVTPAFQGGDTDHDGNLDPGETWTYTGTGTATIGQYANIATVTGVAPFETPEPVTDSDPSPYFGTAVSPDNTSVGALSFTGSDPWTLVLAGAIAVVLGALAIAVTRRRA